MISTTAKPFLRPFVGCSGASDKTLTTFKYYCNNFKIFWKLSFRKNIKTAVAYVIWPETEVERRIHRNNVMKNDKHSHTFATIRYLHTISKHGQDTQEMLHATASLVLYMCCLELSPFWVCDNCYLKGHLWLHSGSVSYWEKATLSLWNKGHKTKRESDSTCPLQGGTEFSPLPKCIIQK